MLLLESLLIQNSNKLFLKDFASAGFLISQSKSLTKDRERSLTCRKSVILMMRTWAIYERGRLITAFILLLICVSTFLLASLTMTYPNFRPMLRSPSRSYIFITKVYQVSARCLVCDRLVDFCSSYRQSVKRLQRLLLDLFKPFDICGHSACRTDRILWVTHSYLHIHQLTCL